MAIQFKKAVKSAAKLRLAFCGPSGSGKTYSSLAVATTLGKKVAVIDTEHGTSAKYADLFEFDVLELETFHPQVYIDAMKAATEAGYDVVVIDSLSHAWMGKDGALELVDRAAARSKSGNTFGAWREVTPLQNKLIDAIVGCKAHVIATMRSKTEYAQERDERTGRMAVRKLGMAPVQRDGMEFEMDIVGELDQSNRLSITKTRCPILNEKVFDKPGADFARILLGWLEGPTAAADRAKEQPKAPEPAKPANGHNGNGAQSHAKAPSIPERIHQHGLAATRDGLLKALYDQAVRPEAIVARARVAKLEDLTAEHLVALYADLQAIREDMGELAKRFPAPQAKSGPRKATKKTLATLDIWRQKMGVTPTYIEEWCANMGVDRVEDATDEAVSSLISEMQQDHAKLAAAAMNAPGGRMREPGED